MGEAAETTVPRRVIPTLKQARLAETIKTAKTKGEAALAAGYAPSTAKGTPSRALASAGYRVSRDTLESKRLDSARGLAGLSAKAAQYSEDDIKKLEPRDRVALVIKAAEAAAALGEDVQQRGNGRAAKDKRARCCRLYKRLILRGLEQQGLIRSDYVNQLVPPNTHNEAPVIDADVVADEPGETLL